VAADRGEGGRPFERVLLDKAALVERQMKQIRARSRSIRKTGSAGEL
jgi:hypothetical protein